MLSDSRKTGLLRLRHLRERTEAKAEEMDAERKRFARLASEQEKPRAVSAFNLFQTPPAVAARMVSLAGPLDGVRVLEPSAGLGRIYRAIREESDCEVVMVEQSADCCRELYGQTEAGRLVQDDFLLCDAERLGGLFDVVLMNPPFKQGRDIKHIRHALTLLRPGGLLVGLCFNGNRQNKQLKPIATTWEPLPADSFRESGTRASVVMLTISAPLSSM
jgi:phospholipid N-methyltransferase